MKKNLIFATNNRHKIEEVSAILDGICNISGLKEIKCFEDIPEDMDTIKENAMQKARFIFDKYGFNCFADDTGLFVESLDGEPGVYSARYAGEVCDSQKNIDKLLDKLKDKANRKAYFMTVIALIIDGNEYFFEGVIKGKILSERHGDGGFGYDPVFMPDGYTQSFAQLGMEEKNKISHRALAIKAMSDFLSSDLC
jgi:XTP/dITP diphosphohydrolase